MLDQKKTANRVVFNTGILYLKMLISMSISLYATRLILNALGAQDYGIFNLVAGIIVMLSFLNSSMTITTQRFISFYLGKGDTNKIKEVFSSSIIVHLVIGIIIVILLEIAGLFLFNGFLNITNERIATAKTIYHFMVISTFFTINAVPYDAAINAHENMLFDAIVGILEACLKLGIAFWILYTSLDKLIFLAVLTACLTIIVRIIKSYYCMQKYEECKYSYKLKINMPLLKELFSFGGWNTLGALINVGRNQGLAILLNIFYGTVINAAYGIANQLSGQISTFSGNMLKAINPQIVKSEGQGDRERMLNLTMVASKFSFYLLAFFAVPLIIEMPFVLKLWLKIIPENTILFSRLFLYMALLVQLSSGLMISIQSVGKIKKYTSTISVILILNIPISYYFLSIGYPAYYALIISIILEIIAFIVRIYFAKKLASLSVGKFIKSVLINSFLPIIICSIISSIPVLFINESLIRLIITCLLSGSVSLFTIWLLGINTEEKKIILNIIRSINNGIINVKKD